MQLAVAAAKRATLNRSQVAVAHQLPGRYQYSIMDGDRV